MSKKVKTAVVIVLLATTMTLMAGCKSKTSTEVENTPEQTEQTGSNEEEKEQEAPVQTKEVNIDDWDFDVPEGYALEDNSGPAYEKRYANENGIVLIFEYHAADNKTDKELFEDQVDRERQDLTDRYGMGEITYQEVNDDKMIITTYYETRDLKVLKSSKIEGQVWKKINIQIPVNENEQDYENILETIE